MLRYIPFILFALAFSSAQAQPGSIDPSFTSGFSVQPSVEVEAIALQPDGKILAVGAFYTHEGDSSRGVVRFDPDGSRDAGFSVGSGLLDNWPEFSGYSGRGMSVAVQADGKILVGGYFSTYNGSPANSIIRLNADGSIDQGFNVGLGFNGAPVQIIIQADGKILCGGNMGFYNGMVCNKVVRLLPGGALDSSFTAPTITGNVSAMALQPDGKVVIGGSITAVGSTTVGRLARLNSDGSLDTDLVQGIGFNSGVLAIHVTDDGRITVGGMFSMYNGIPQQRIARLMPDGSLDETFQVVYDSSPDRIRAIVQQADGRYILLGGIAGVDGDTRSNVVRMEIDGAVDPTFQPGSCFSNVVLDALIQPDGQLLAAGHFTGYDNLVSSGVARVNTSGTTAIADVQEADFELYPNPSTGRFQLQAAMQGHVQLKVYDLLGRTVHSETTAASAGWTHDLELGHLLPGGYLLELIGTNGRSTARFIKQ